MFVGDHFQAKIPDLELRNHRHLQQQMGNRSSQVMVDPRMEGKSDDEAMADLLGKIFFFKIFSFSIQHLFHLLLLLLLLFHYHLLLSLSSPSSPLLLAFSLFFFPPFLFFPCFLVTWGDSPPLDTPETAAEVEILSFQRCLVDPEQGLPRLSLLSLGFLLISPVSPLGCYLLSGIVPGACAAGHTRLLLGYCS